MVEQKKAEGLKPPLGEGVLIFDEVKVAMKVSWNSRNEELVGLAMTSILRCKHFRMCMKLSVVTGRHRGFRMCCKHFGVI